MIDSEGRLKISSILYLGVICAVLSFSPFTGGSGVFSIGMYFCFGGYILSVLIGKNMKIQVNSFAKQMICAYLIWKVITALLNATGIYPHSSMGVAALLEYCVFFYCIGYNVLCHKDSKISLNIVMSFTIGIIVFSAMAIGKIRSISDVFYTFGGKNQTGQMIGIGILLLLFVLPEYCDHFWKKAMCYLSAVVLLMELLLLRSRTPLVGIAATFVLWFVQRKDKQTRDYINLIAIVIVCAGTLLFFGGRGYLGEVFLGRLDRAVSYDKSTALNIVLSGRIDIWVEAITDFLKNPATGVGAWAYIDNHILNVLRTGGLLLGALVFPISYGKMYTTYKKASSKLKGGDINDSQQILANALKALIPFLFIISLMEGFPPLGPGTSMFLYWLLMGMYDRICL